jgi:hypothetical protein
LVGALAGLIFGLAAVWGRGREEPEEAAKPAEPHVYIPAARPDTLAVDDVDVIRSEIAAMRDRLRSHSAAS